MTAKRSCSSTGVGQKPKETRQRVLISTQYERKIDQIEERLGRIERLLRGLPALIQQAGFGHGGTHADGGRDAGVASFNDPPNQPMHRQQQLPLRQTPGTSTTAASSRASITPSLPPPSEVGPSVGSLGVVPSPAPAPVPPQEETREARDQKGGRDPDSPFEGESSMTAHTVFASEFLQNAVGQRPEDMNALLHNHPRMHGALSSLQSLVELQKRSGATLEEISFPHQKPLPPGGFRELPMPGANVVVKILRELKDYTPVSFTYMRSIIGIEDYTGHCRRVFFDTEDYSQASYIIVNAGLVYIFQEKALSSEGDEYKRYHEICRTNLETALAHFNLLQPARRENVEALLLGSNYAVEIAKPSLAWQLNAAASQLCMTMGYHRGLSPPMSSALSPQQSTPEANIGLYEGDSSEEIPKRELLFWQAYMIDKALALRLGRPAVIPDSEVTISRKLRRLAEFDEFRPVLQTWLRHARVQGRIYEDLYSPESLGRPMAARLAAARECADELKTLASMQAPMQMAFSPAFRDECESSTEAGKVDMLEMAMKSDEVSILGSLALVYRAIPPDMTTGGATSRTFNSECIEVAREAVQAHMEAMNLFQASNDLATAYVHWTILYAPFIPFIVLFCHVIETFNTDDLNRLRGFVGSLEAPRSISNPVEKLYRLSSALANVAAIYVEARTQMPPQSNNDSNEVAMPFDEFDMYLRNLGFMAPPSQQQQPTGAGGADPTTADPQHNSQAQQAQAEAQAQQFVAQAQNGPQLGDWYSGNLTMMGLLEGNMPIFNNAEWPGQSGM